MSDQAHKKREGKIGKCPDFGKIYPGCDHLWFKFII